MRAKTKEEQQAIGPEDGLRILREGNERFRRVRLADRELRDEREHSADGQLPFAAFLGCVDSRVPVEQVFDLELGDAFIARVAGNVVNSDILGSLEFACGVAGARLIVVLGHTACGAVAGACQGVELGHLTGLLARLRPVVDAVRAEDGLEGEELEDRVTHRNVEASVRSILERSDVLRELVEAGTVGIVGALYDVRTGEVEFHELVRGPI